MEICIANLIISTTKWNALHHFIYIYISCQGAYDYYDFSGINNSNATN